MINTFLRNVKVVEHSPNAISFVFAIGINRFSIHSEVGSLIESSFARINQPTTTKIVIQVSPKK